MDPFTIFCAAVGLPLVIWAFWLCRAESLRCKKWRDVGTRLANRYPGNPVMMTSNGAAIYIVEDRIWIDSGYIEEYIETRSSRKVNWQKEGF